MGDESTRDPQPEPEGAPPEQPHRPNGWQAEPAHEWDQRLTARGRRVRRKPGVRVPTTHGGQGLRTVGALARTPCGRAVPRPRPHQRCLSRQNPRRSRRARPNHSVPHRHTVPHTGHRRCMPGRHSRVTRSSLLRRSEGPRFRERLRTLRLHTRRHRCQRATHRPGPYQPRRAVVPRSGWASAWSWSLWSSL
jgi:hypothetical protein